MAPAAPGPAPTPGPGAVEALPQSSPNDGAPLPPPPRFDMEDSESDDEAATVMMDVQDTDLSTAIEEALARQQATGAGGALAGQAMPPTAGADLAAQLQGPAGLPATGTPVGTPPMGGPGAGAPPHPHFELLVAESEPENAGLRRALIVAVILLVLVVAAVVVLYLGQEGVFSY